MKRNGCVRGSQRNGCVRGSQRNGSSALLLAGLPPCCCYKTVRRQNVPLLHFCVHQERRFVGACPAESEKKMITTFGPVIYFFSEKGRTWFAS